MGKGTGWRVLAALIGMIGVLIGYFWVHKPLDPALVFTIGGAALDMLTAGLIVSVAGGLGRRIVDKFVGATNALSMISRAEKISLEALLGLGILSLAALLLGLVGLFQGIMFWILLLVVGGVSLRATLAWISDFRAIFRSALQTESGWMRFLMLTCAFFLLTALLLALAPPTAFDALNYHLVAPQRYLAAGRIAAQPDNHFLGLSQGAEVLYGLAIGLSGRETAAAPLHFAFGLLALLAVAGLVRRFADRAAALLTVTLVLSAYSIWLLFGWPYIDLAVMAYSAAAFVSITLWREIRTVSDMPYRVPAAWLIFTGVYAGFALDVKYLAAGLLASLLIYLLWNAPRQFVRNALILGGTALIVFLPWALKGILLYQNPVYPFIFGGVNWDAGRSNTFSTAGLGLLGTPDVWQLVVMPFAATILGKEGGNDFSFTLSPWLLTAPFLLLLGWRWLDERGRTLARDCALLGLPLLAFWIGIAAWSGIGSQTRLMMMGMPIAATAAGLGFHSLSRWPHKPLDMAFMARALVTLTLVFSLLEPTRHVVESKVVPYLMGTVSRDEYLANNIISGFDSYVAAMHELETLPAGSQVRLMFEPRTYYCPPNVACFGDMLFDHWARPLQHGASPDEVFQSWKDGGDDNLLLFNPGYQFNAGDARFAKENALFPDALQKWMSPVWTDEAGWYTLYQWKP